MSYINSEPWGVAIFNGTGYQLWWPCVQNYTPNMAYWAGLPITNIWLNK